MDEDEDEEEEIMYPLNEMFQAYCEMDPVSKSMKVNLIPLSQCDKWFEAAQVLDMVRLTTTDTGLCFFKFRKRAINYEQFVEYVKDVSDTRRLDFTVMKHKLQLSPKPNIIMKKKKQEKQSK